MKRGVQFADSLSDDGSEELKTRQQQADASPSNTGGASDDHLVGTWKAEQDLLQGTDKKPKPIRFESIFG